MKGILKLEDFGSAKKQASVSLPASNLDLPVAGPSAEELEAKRIEVYEQGYQAGWDDAVNAQAQDQERVSIDLAQNLKDLGFTFHEAKSHVIKTLEPLLSEVVSKVLPNLASETLKQKVLEELLPFAEDVSDTPVQIIVSPDDRVAIEALLDTSLTIPLEILEEPSLAAGQVRLRLAELEKKIDMKTAIDRIGDAIQSIYLLNEEVLKNG